MPLKESREKPRQACKKEKHARTNTRVLAEDVQKAAPEDVLFIKPNPVKDEDAAKSLCYGFVMQSGNGAITEGELNSIDGTRKCPA